MGRKPVHGSYSSRRLFHITILVPVFPYAKVLPITNTMSCRYINQTYIISVPFLADRAISYGVLYLKMLELKTMINKSGHLSPSAINCRQYFRSNINAELRKLRVELEKKHIDG